MQHRAVSRLSDSVCDEILPFCERAGRKLLISGGFLKEFACLFGERLV